MASAILISFWLDPFANERLPVTLLLLLLNSVYLQYMHQVIPNNGTSVPLTSRISTLLFLLAVEYHISVFDVVFMVSSFLL